MRTAHTFLIDDDNDDNDDQVQKGHGEKKTWKVSGSQ